ncbi:gluconate 2-dehydrogenase subunit 3 family protein [Flaviramulus sp. BrNp1-15]|uniref:gluconate 2-dehydrogenase subunit 3 family protein n=1 Tax=Flaviramulus sp. BrNp1-15 TaxID=2916754 RepID=UPI001EE79A82|nr:gluconate 2-dehydrogenase subunit 3 family protein [Flaviramulus sp. BrNp1-15]ULC60854.1 gluconate 2-dehydrogenase subunit 3 family protein [Flaviramulus sp. BrNp1-15]
MERRKAIKNLGLSLGFVVSTPTILNILQGCKSNVEPWLPVFFNIEEGNVLEKLVDIILPKTDTPGALDVNVPQFIDTFINETFETEEKADIKTQFSLLINTIKTKYNQNIDDVSYENYDDLLASYFKIDDEKLTSWEKQIEAYKASENKNVSGYENALQFDILNNIRSMSVFAFKTSELIGEKVLAYNPIPGTYIPCGNLDELTKGKAWSL